MDRNVVVATSPPGNMQREKEPYTQFCDVGVPAAHPASYPSLVRPSVVLHSLRQTDSARLTNGRCRRPTVLPRGGRVPSASTVGPVSRRPPLWLGRRGCPRQQLSPLLSFSASVWEEQNPRAGHCQGAAMGVCARCTGAPSPVSPRIGASGGGAGGADVPWRLAWRPRRADAASPPRRPRPVVGATPTVSRCVLRYVLVCRTTNPSIRTPVEAVRQPHTCRHVGIAEGGGGNPGTGKSYVSDRCRDVLFQGYPTQQKSRDTPVPKSVPSAPRRHA